MAIPVNRLGWMAGVIDLKGKLLIKRNKQRATAQHVLVVQSKEAGVVSELSKMTGTKPEMVTTSPLPDFMRRNCSQHCPEAHVHVSETLTSMPQMGRWSCTGAAMVVVLDNLLPYLVVDRGWEEVIEKIEDTTTLSSHGSGAVLASLRRLRDLGWVLPGPYDLAVRSKDVSNTGSSV